MHRQCDWHGQTVFPCQLPAVITGGEVLHHQYKYPVCAYQDLHGRDYIPLVLLLGLLSQTSWLVVFPTLPPYIQSMFLHWSIIYLQNIHVPHPHAHTNIHTHKSKIMRFLTCSLSLNLMSFKPLLMTERLIIRVVSWWFMVHTLVLGLVSNCYQQEIQQEKSHASVSTSHFPRWEFCVKGILVMVRNI